jgi:hypothetical protein
MVWISGPEPDWAGAYDALLAAVRSRTIPLTRLNAAVTRIVTVKRELGLRTPRRPVPVPTAPAVPGAAPGPTGPTGAGP